MDGLSVPVSTTSGLRAPVRRSPVGRWWGVAVLLVGGSMAVLVGRDGAAGWQVARVAVTAGLTWAAVLAVTRGRVLVRGVVGFGVGILGTAVGAGIAVPHAAAVGWSVVTVAGAVCLAAGLVLLVGGGVTTIRAVPSWWGRVLAIPAVILTAYAAVFALALAVVATNVPATALGGTDPAGAGLPFRDVSLTTADGVQLSGWYIPGGSGAAVALVHGSGSTRSDVLPQAQVLARNGFGVLLFDARGHGRSAGRAMDFGWYGDQDVTAAVDYLASRPEVTGGRIGVVGISMGGEEAIGAMASDPRIRAVVAEGATNRTAADKAWLPTVYGVRGALQQALDTVMYATADLLTDAGPPIPLRDAAARAAPRPVLLITAGAVPDEDTAARYIQAGSPDTVDILTVPDAPHAGGLATDPTLWQTQVTAFLTSNLR